MRSKYLCIFLLFVVSIFFSCNDNSDDSNNIHITQVTFVDNGSVVPDPVSIIVIISSDSIEYSTSQSGIITEQWSEQIQSSDFESLQQLVEDYDLFQMNNITLEEGQPSCDGWSGMTITIDQTDSSNSFDIIGVVCSGQWPDGVSALVDLKNELVTKYQ